MVSATGLREPNRLLTYRAHISGIGVNNTPVTAACYYCRAIRHTREQANMRRYITTPSPRT